MSFVALPLCVRSGTPVSHTNKPQALDANEKALLITDFVVSFLVITIGALVVLHLKYGVDLGSLSSLGSIGLDAAYAMIGVGVGIVGLDVTKLIIQLARHINGLTNHAIPALIGNLSQLQSINYEANRRLQLLSNQIDSANERLEQDSQLNSRKDRVTRENGELSQENRATEALDEQIRLRDQKIEELNQQIDALQQETNNALRKRESLEEELKLLNQHATEKDKLLEQAQVDVEKVPQLISKIDHLTRENQSLTEAMRVLEELNQKLEQFPFLEQEAQKVEGLQNQVKALQEQKSQALSEKALLEEQLKNALEQPRVGGESNQSSQVGLEKVVHPELEKTLTELQQEKEKNHLLEIEKQEALKLVQKAKEALERLESQKQVNRELSTELESLKEKLGQEEKSNRLKSLNSFSFSELKSPLEEEQAKLIDKALTFRPSTENNAYDLNKLDFSKITKKIKKTIHSTLNLKDGYKSTINELNRIRDAVINEAKVLREDLSKDHSEKLEQLGKDAKTLKGYLEKINKEAKIEYRTLFTN